MYSFQSTGVTAVMIFVLNIPFGFWRAQTKKLSRQWFLAVHIPVVLSIGLRLLVGVGFVLRLLPLFVGAFFLGQALGGSSLLAFMARSDS